MVPEQLRRNSIMQHHHPAFRPVGSTLNNAETGELCVEARAARSEKIAEVLAGKSGIWALAGLENTLSKWEAKRSRPKSGGLNIDRPLLRSFRHNFRHKAAHYFTQVARGNSDAWLASLRWRAE
jgi:hypothetical protein